MTNKELREHGIGSRFAQTATGYKRAVANAVKQFNLLNDGFAELYTQDTIIIANISEKSISLDIMTKSEDCSVVDAAAFRARILELVPHFTSQILREEKRHRRTN